MASSIPLIFVTTPLLLTFLLIFLIHHSAASFGPLDFLKTNGTVLRNAKGDLVHLRGVNLGGWLIQEKWMGPMDSCNKEGCNVCGCPRMESQVMCTAPDELSLQSVLEKRFQTAKMEELLNVYRDAWIKETDLDNIQQLGLNLVRVPIFYRNFMDDEGKMKPAEYSVWKRLDWLMEECSQRGIYVVFDLHGTVGQQNMWDNSGKINSSPQLWKNDKYQDDTVALWEKLADHFKDNPALAAYDLINEPDRMPAKQLNDFYDRIYKAIRQIDPKHAIVIEAPWSFKILDKPATRGWTNVIYSMHVYNIANWYNRGKQEKLVETYLDGIRKYQKEWGVPVFVGEFCLFKEYDLWEKFINGLNDMDVSWSHWSYKMTPEDFGPFYWAHFVNNTNPVPNPAVDSVEIIAEKWKKFGTENFVPNTDFQGMISRCAKGDCRQQSSNTSPSNTFSSRLLLTTFMTLLFLFAFLLD